MTTTFATQNLSNVNSGNLSIEAASTIPALPHESKATASEGKHRESFLNALLRAFSAVSF